MFGIAGCLGDDDDAVDDADDVDEPDDVVFTTAGGDDPEPLEMNPYNPDASWGGWSGQTWIRPTVFDTAESEWHHRTVDDWAYDDETMTINFNDDYSWTNGDPVTAYDFVAKINLEMYTGAPVGDYFESFIAEDDYTAVGQLADEFVGMAESIMLQQVFHWADSAYDTPWEFYGEFVEDFREAESEEDFDAVDEALLEFSLDPREDDAPFSGVTDFVDLDERRMLWRVRDDFPNTENIDFEDWESVIGMSEEEAARTGSFDVNFGRPGEPEEWDPRIEQRGDVPVAMGHALVFNQRDYDHLAPREVRHAFAHMIDNDLFVEVVETHGNHLPVEHQTGMPPEYAEEWLGGETDFLTNHHGHDYDRAAELLVEAGYEENGDTWLRPDGEEFTPELFVPQWWPEVIEFATAEIQSFGINAESRVAEWPTFDEQVNRDANFEIAWTFVGATFMPHPFFDYQRTFTGVLEGGADVVDVWGIDPEFDIPMPRGDPGGNIETVDTRELVDDLLFVDDEEEEIELIQELAWVYNQALPYYQFDSYHDQWIWNVEDWDLPDEDHWVWTTPHPQYLVFEEGLIQANPGTDSQA